MNSWVSSLLVVFSLQIIGFAAYFIVEPLVLSNSHYGYLGKNLFILSLFFAGVVGVLVAAFLRKRTTKSAIVSLSVLSAINFLGYSNLYNIIIPVSLERSFSVSIFMDLANRESGWISEKDFFNIKDSHSIYKLRVDEMLESGLVEKLNGGYALTSKGRSVANLYLYANKYLRIQQ